MNTTLDNLENIEGLLAERKQEEQDFRGEADRRNEGFKTRLFSHIFVLTWVSFIFLVAVIVFRVAWKIRHPEYTLVSDNSRLCCMCTFVHDLRHF